MARTIRCLYCDEPHDFLPGKHFRREDHFESRDGAFERFKDWVADEYDLDRDHDVFQTPGALTSPDGFDQFRDLFQEPGHNHEKP